LLAFATAAGGLAVLLPGVASAADSTGPTGSTGSTIDSPGPGPYTSATTLTLAGTVRRSPTATDPVSLRLTDPTGAAGTVATRSDNGSLSVAWRTTCAYDLAGCGQSGMVRPARNGTWTLSMVGDTGEPAPGPRTFALTIPPATPQQVSVTPTPGSVRVSWRNGGEPDLTGADILADGAVVTSAPACSGSCSATAPLPAGKHSIAVREHRARCPHCSGDLLSAASVATPVTVSAALAAPGLRQGGALSAAAQRALDSGGGPDPTVPGQPSATAAGGEPTQDGTYGAYLPYSNASPSAAAVDSHGPLAATKASLARRGVLVPIAVALLLALAGLHVRRWARTGDFVSPISRVSPSGKSPR
jgi:hypothetical protein